MYFVPGVFSQLFLKPWISFRDSENAHRKHKCSVMVQFGALVSVLFSVWWCISQLNRLQMCFYFVCFHKINTEDTIPELFLNDMKAFNFMDYFSISRFIWYSSLSQTFPGVRPFLFRVHVLGIGQETVV